MTRFKLAIAVAAVLAGSAALAQQPSTTRQDGTTRAAPGDFRTDSQNRDNANRSNTDRSTTGGTAATNRTSMDSTNRSDEKFLKNFAQANAAEIETGKIAQAQAQNSEVKAFAKHMVDEHSKTLAKLETIAAKTNTDVKAEPDMMHKAKAALLDRKDGSAFDAAYMKAMVKDHEQVVEMLQEQIKDGKDASVKQLASAALPGVQKHLKTAQDLHAKVSMDKSSSNSSSRNEALRSNTSDSSSSSTKPTTSR